jgi:hypothetical protein
MKELDSMYRWALAGVFLLAGPVLGLFIGGWIGAWVVYPGGGLRALGSAFLGAGAGVVVGPILGFITGSWIDDWCARFERAERVRRRERHNQKRGTSSQV